MWQCQEAISKFLIFIFSVSLCIGCSGKLPSSQEEAVVCADCAEMPCPTGTVMMAKAAPVSEMAANGAVPDRKLHNSADCTLEVRDCKMAVDSAAAIVRETGGQVLHSDVCSISVSVPQALFRETLDRLLVLGHVVSESISGQDITDSYYDSKARLRVLNETKARLEKLFDNASSASDKVKILKELDKILDEIEAVSALMDRMEREAAYADITIYFISISSVSAEPYRFEWIERLVPAEITADRLYGRILLKAPETFGVLDRMRSFYAESSCGTQLRVGSVRNFPKGDSLFWQRALEYHFSAMYEDCCTLEAGTLRGILVTSGSMRYFVGTAVNRGNLLYVVEAYFPDDVSFQQDHDAVIAALEGFRIR